MSLINQNKQLKLANQGKHNFHEPVGVSQRIERVFTAAHTRRDHCYLKDHTRN